MAMVPVDIEVTENNDAEVEVWLTSTTGGVTTATDLTGSSLEFYAKDNTAQTDANAPIKYSTVATTISILSPTTAGKLVISMVAANLVAGAFPYHLDRIKAGKRLTVLYGKLRVANV